MRQNKRTVAFMIGKLQRISCSSNYFYYQIKLIKKLFVPESLAELHGGTSTVQPSLTTVTTLFIVTLIVSRSSLLSITIAYPTLACSISAKGETNEHYKVLLLPT